MVEQDPASGEHSVGFAVVDSYMMGVSLRAAVGRAGMERSVFVLRRRRLSEHLRRRCLIELGARADGSQRLQHPQSSKSCHISSLLSHSERHAHIAFELPDGRPRRAALPPKCLSSEAESVTSPYRSRKRSRLIPSSRHAVCFGEEDRRSSPCTS